MSQADQNQDVIYEAESRHVLQRM